LPEARQKTAQKEKPGRHGRDDGPEQFEAKTKVLRRKQITLPGEGRWRESRR
jgi:hypothetical protein